MYHKNKQPYEESLALNEELHLSLQKISNVTSATFFWYRAKLTEENLASRHHLSLSSWWIYLWPFNETVISYTTGCEYRRE